MNYEHTWNETAVELVAEDGLLYAHATAEGLLVLRSELVRTDSDLYAPVAEELAGGAYELSESVVEEYSDDSPVIGRSVTEFYTKVGA
ncbi:hypothetical protein [Gordonia sp. SID5947]|uniref:hypothetical protein n=1 Tax=Gordonia sp. SID5947 TaxID=2690315 RepID=UPI001F1EDB5D|nr:hypothetical protein [Gordonia sp. SID5947]